MRPQKPVNQRWQPMNNLADIATAVETYNRSVEDRVHRARSEERFADELRTQWQQAVAAVGQTTTPTGLRIPRLALPQTDDAGEMARYLYGEGLPGEFPFVNSIYPQVYVQHNGKAGSSYPRPGTPGRGQGEGSCARLLASRRPNNRFAEANPTSGTNAEEPTRLFAGFALAEDTNKRFHYLTGQQRSVRLSTAFDGPTLYGIDSDTDGALGKIGEGGTAIDTVDDMVRLYDGFDLGAQHLSVSMTINAPAPSIMAMFVAAARRRFGPEVIPKLRGTVQADILKEVQAQNEVIFPPDASLRFLTDMVEYTTTHMPRWYPISISGYHIAEAGATPIQQAAYTLSNGFAYAQLFRERGLDVNSFGPRLSFFLDCGLDIEYLVLARVCRKIWAVGMRDVFSAGPKAQLFKLHTQTSGRSLIARDFRNNLTRTAIELLMAYINATNSCHSNSADEPFTTPSEDYVRLAAHAQSILLEESGLFKHMMNLFGSSPGMRQLEAAVEAGILEEFRRIDSLGGVLPAMEQRYQRSQIQASAHRYEQQVNSGARPIVGLNVYRGDADGRPEMHVVRTPLKKQRGQIARLREFKRKHAKPAAAALDRLERVVNGGGNVFAELIETVEQCSLGQITARLQEIVGRYRPMV
jgi:methylmalonyl-CoA mutase